MTASTITASTVAALPSTSDAVTTDTAIDPRVEQLWSFLDVATPKEVADAIDAGTDQQGIAQCMAATGFEYTPESFEPATYDLKLGLSDEEFAANYGFGIAAFPLGVMPNQNVGSDATGGVANEPYLATLSTAQRTAFESSYRSCKQQHSTPFVNGYQTAIEEYRALINSDQRVVDATTTWSQCMALSGLQYAAPQQMRNDIAGPVSQTSDPTELRSILKVEIAAAVANVGCEPPYLDVYRAVLAERIDEFDTFVSELPDDASGAQG